MSHPDPSRPYPRPARSAPLPALALVLALAGTAAPVAQETTAESPADSAAFAQKRRMLLEAGPDVRTAAILEAAEELARDGYWAEALELVYDLGDTAWTAEAAASYLDEVLPDTPAADAPAPVALPAPAPPFYPARSYVRSSFEYDDWDDQPFGGEVRARMEWLPEGSFLERVTPTFAGSDRRAFFGLAGRGSAFGRVLKVEGEALAEKKLWQAYGDSLDRLSFLALAEAGTRPLGRALSATLPLRVEIDQYRADRLGLLSRRSAAAAPAVEAVSADWRRGVLLAWDIRRLEFPDSPPSGYWSHGPSLLANWYGDRFTLEGEAQWLDDRYDRDTSLHRSGTWESRAAVYLRPWRPLKAGVRLFHSAEDSRYLDTVYAETVAGADTLEEAVRARYALSGWSVTVQPVVTVEWAAAYSVSLSLAWSRGRYPMLEEAAGRALAFPQYLDEDYEGWKPEATFSILSRRLFLNMSMSYEMHAPAASPHYFQGYSEGLGLVGHCAWKASPSMEVDFSGLWRRRLDDKPTPGEVQDMTSLSMGLVSRFQ